MQNLVRICDSKIPFTRSELRNKLDQLTSIIDCYDDEEE